MKIALYQMHIVWENKEVNYLQLERKLKEVYAEKVDLFLMPEMSFTGFSMNIDVTKESRLETVNIMAGYAQQYNVAVGFGWVKDCGEKSENHYTIISKDGEILCDYVKIHPFSFSGENEKFRGGERIKNFICEGIACSIFICYDLRFPEIFQVASRKAHIIFVPANWPQKRQEHWRCLLQARAIENQVYIIAVNCVGEIGGVDYLGDSCVISPNGEVLTELCGREGVLMYELVDDVENYRNVFRVKDDRNEQLYYRLMNVIDNCKF